MCGQYDGDTRVVSADEIFVHMPVYDTFHLRHGIYELHGAKGYVVGGVLRTPVVVLALVTPRRGRNKTADTVSFPCKGKQLTAVYGFMKKEHHGEVFFRFAQKIFLMVGVKLKVAVVQGDKIHSVYDAGAHSDVVFVESLHITVAAELIFFGFRFFTQVVAEIVIPCGIENIVFVDKAANLIEVSVRQEVVIISRVHNRSIKLTG